MPKISGEKTGNGIQAVAFALKTLEYLALRQSTVGVSELARQLGTTKSRMHRHLQTLVSAGYIVQDEETERYGVSTRLMALGRAISENFDVANAARHILIALRDKVGLNVVLSVPEPDGIRIVRILRNKSQMEIGVKLGSLLPYHTSAQGKVSLAYSDPALLAHVMHKEMPMATPYSITSGQKLQEDVAQIQKQGWGDAPNEALIGLNALAAPVFDALGKLAGTVSIVDSIQYIPENPTPDQVKIITQAGNDISAALGYRAENAPSVSEADIAPMSD